MEFENNQVPEAILDKLTKVCTCRSITRKTIKEAIFNGAHTFPAVKEATRAGTGCLWWQRLWSAHRKITSGTKRTRSHLTLSLV